MLTAELDGERAGLGSIPRRITDPKEGIDSYIASSS